MTKKKGNAAKAAKPPKKVYQSDLLRRKADYIINPPVIDRPCGNCGGMREVSVSIPCPECKDPLALVIQANGALMLAALKNISFYARIRHEKAQDYGKIADKILKRMKVPTGQL